MAGPLEQFTIAPLGKARAFGEALPATAMTNTALWMLIAAAAATLLLYFAMSRRTLVPGRLQSVASLFYETIAGMVRDTVGKGEKYFPFIFTLFMFILFANVLGLIPGSFTATSHLAVTFALAAFIFVCVTVIGFAVHGLGYLRMFFPHGAPWWVGIILIPVEIVSYLSRPISLGVRLFANMTVGHVLLKVITGFVIALGVFGVVPLLGLVALNALESMVAVIQAYVFTILTCVYLHDALHMH